MLGKLKNISLSNWILIGMVLGLLTGLILNFFVPDSFLKNTLLVDNVFYLGGSLFIKLMKMLVVPLVFCSIVVGAASISDIRKIGSIGGRTIGIYLITTALAVTLALAIGMLIKPGVGKWGHDSSNHIWSAHRDNIGQTEGRDSIGQRLFLSGKQNHDGNDFNCNEICSNRYFLFDGKDFCRPWL